jgi:hypothetical protein
MKVENDKLDFVEGVKKKFDEQPWLAADGDLSPGSYFAMRWGMGDDCILVLKLDEDHRPEVYQQALDKDTAEKTKIAHELLKDWGDRPGLTLKEMMMKQIIKEYKIANPARTADTHDERCCCMRCVVDKLEGYFENPAVQR